MTFRVMSFRFLSSQAAGGQGAFSLAAPADGILPGKRELVTVAEWALLPESLKLLWPFLGFGRSWASVSCRPGALLRPPSCGVCTLRHDFCICGGMGQLLFTLSAELSGVDQLRVHLLNWQYEGLAGCGSLPCAHSRCIPHMQLKVLRVATTWDPVIPGCRCPRCCSEVLSVTKLTPQVRSHNFKNDYFGSLLQPYFQTSFVKLIPSLRKVVCIQLH